MIATFLFRAIVCMKFNHSASHTMRLAVRAYCVDMCALQDKVRRLEAELKAARAQAASAVHKRPCRANPRPGKRVPDPTVTPGAHCSCWLSL